MYSFVLAMMLYPNVQKRAQSELDAVVGNGRLPSFEDRDRLPFVEAIVKETFRWGPPARVSKFTIAKLSLFIVEQRLSQIFLIVPWRTIFKTDISFRKELACWPIYGSLQFSSLI